jgi:chemotaxis protein CheD
VLNPNPEKYAFTPAMNLPVVDPVYVPPGRLATARDGKPLTTIVSSGAVVCVWDSVSGAGGMAHFLLPEVGAAPPAPRFGDVALRSLLEEMAKLGVPEKRLRARVFGGSAPPIATSAGHLGDRNIEAAHAFLKSRFVPVLENQAGGNTARKILFAPTSGQATVTRVGAS